MQICTDRAGEYIDAFNYNAVRIETIKATLTSPAVLIIIYSQNLNSNIQTTRQIGLSISYYYLNMKDVY